MTHDGTRDRTDDTFAAESGTVSEHLRVDHQRILAMVGVLERILDAGEQSWDLDDLGACIEFFQLFTDACHHGMEEDVLFPELIEHGLPRDQGPIAVMLHEHGIGRALVGRMAGSLEALQTGGALQAETFEAVGREYVELIRNHIMKEDNVLFEMADGMVQGPACRRVCRAYHEICSRRFAGRTRADLEVIADRLLEAYPAG